MVHSLQPGEGGNAIRREERQAGRHAPKQHRGNPSRPYQGYNEGLPALVAQQLLEDSGVDKD